MKIDQEFNLIANNIFKSNQVQKLIKFRQKLVMKEFSDTGLTKKESRFKKESERLLNAIDHAQMILSFDSLMKNQKEINKLTKRLEKELQYLKNDNDWKDSGKKTREEHTKVLKDSLK